MVVATDMQCVLEEDGEISCGLERGEENTLIEGSVY
jgi:hypothetical protein